MLSNTVSVGYSCIVKWNTSEVLQLNTLLIIVMFSVCEHKL
jgi:hypothetical protein